MKNKKILATLLSLITLISAFGVTASAKQEIPLENGGKLVIYEDNDEIPELPAARSIPMTFNKTFPKYSSYNFVHGSDGDESIPMGYNTTIRFTFNAKPTAFYINVWDQYQQKFVTAGSVNGLTYVSNPSRVFDLVDMQAYNTYKIGFAGNGYSISLAGTVTVQ
jgi:hypothetical protein